MDHGEAYTGEYTLGYFKLVGVKLQPFCRSETDVTTADTESVNPAQGGFLLVFLPLSWHVLAWAN